MILVHFLLEISTGAIDFENLSNLIIFATEHLICAGILFGGFDIFFLIILQIHSVYVFINIVFVLL